MTPIESAARALSQDYWAGKCNAEQLAAYVDRTWPRYVGRVRLVLEAVREASGDMVDAGAPIIADLACLGDADGPAPDSEFTGYADAVWQAMIDAVMGGTVSHKDGALGKIDRLKALKGEAI